MRSVLALSLPLLLVFACGGEEEPGGENSSGGEKTSGGQSSGTSGTSSGNGSSGGGASSGGASSGGVSSGSSGVSSSSSGAPDPLHNDGIKNLDETDIDCGGETADPCAPSKSCLLPRDCTSAVCTEGVCAEPSYTDEVKNGDETGVDCGGPNAPNRCPTGEGCAAPGDCVEGVCNAELCASPTHTDGVKNGDETGVDCGGPTAPNKCAPGQGCAAPGDCVEGVCEEQLCSVPTDDDGVRNNGEMGVDCGGPNTVKTCPAGTACNDASDCTSAACAYNNVCVEHRSCVRRHGGDTCGAGESFGANQHESCCTTIPVGNGGAKLDKYNITAGRFRAFVDATGANIRGWIEEHTPNWWRADWTNYLPTGEMTPVVQVQSTVRNLGVFGQLGPNFVYDQTGQFGCWSGASAGESGGQTYWIPLDKRQQMNANDVGSQYPQDMLDQKPLNCVNALMLAAFCAWDGGRLPSKAELDAAWGPATYPWGNSPAPAGYANGYPAPGTHNPAGGDPLRANHKKNYPVNQAGWDAYKLGFNLPTPGVQGNDLAWYIAPPGRFPTGAGPYGHQDLAGNVFDVSSNFSGNAGTATLSTTNTWSKSGSWEGHVPPYETASPMLRKYWAQGGRCVKN